ncbi:putative quinol monooxygenase [Nonomuraea angiospora]|uniref:putative quinol monooxygenase n=1 Tax=Nonomuraea angiospora TaxID=46172 RepID=UPI0029BDCAA3|nr:antibiotic biosynthesis monooxygenase [Nonomuraea angiospora]MDX3102716.1 antibiotic biosynthesis monooxygenase [Nonomuraea angiospora]
MFVVIVQLQVRPGRLETFLDGIRANARATRGEPGCLRSFCHPVSLQGQAT